MRVETLNDLFYLELRELFDEEERLLDALPKMARSSSSARLREAFQEHLEQTRNHVSRLHDCFRDLQRAPNSDKSRGMKGLVDEGEHVISNLEQSPLRDAALIAAARRVEHYEIAAYSAAIAFARVLGHERLAGLLEKTLKEEQETDAMLTEIADTTVNQEALQLGAHQAR